MFERKYVNPDNGRGWKLSAEEREAIRQDKTTSQALLAMLYDVDPVTIRYIQDPARYKLYKDRTNANRKLQRQEARERKLKRKTKKKPPEPPLNDYEKAIRNAIDTGMGVDAIEEKLNANLSQLIRNRLQTEEQINEVRKMQDALFRFLNPEPVLLVDSESTAVKIDVPIHMTGNEMKMLMIECGLKSRGLAEALNKKYTIRSIIAYRNGLVPVPKDVADVLRGYPKKSHVRWV